jgi:hypothetical protein
MREHNVVASSPIGPRTAPSGGGSYAQQGHLARHRALSFEGGSFANQGPPFKPRTQTPGDRRPLASSINAARSHDELAARAGSWTGSVAAGALVADPKGRPHATGAVADLRDSCRVVQAAPKTMIEPISLRSSCRTVSVCGQTVRCMMLSACSWTTFLRADGVVEADIVGLRSQPVNHP